MSAPTSGLFPDAIVRWGEANPDDIAIRHGEGSWSYRRLLATSAAVASGLSTRGYGAGALVGVCLPRGPELIGALLGVLRAGAAYLPLDPGDPPARLAITVEDAIPGCVLTSATLRDRAPGHHVEVEQLLVSEPAAGRQAPASGDSTAFVIATSGTTGRPKCVAVPHRCVTALFDAMDDHVSARPGDVWLSFTSPAFDVSVFEFFWTLARGVTVELADTSGAALFASSLTDPAHDITHMQGTPTLMAGLLLDPATRDGIGRLRHLTVTGEALPAHLARDLASLVPGMLLNAYGPTETTLWATVETITEPVAEPVTIGRPLRGQYVRILDEAGSPVRPGAVGELHIGGSGVAEGYLHQPELTAERFIVDPFTSTSAARLYRSGDLARQLPDGRIVCLGRSDRQVKIRGHRIELDDVEHALLGLAGVDGGAVVTEGDGVDRRIIAYVVAADAPTSRELRVALAELLPPASVPGEIRMIDELPRTTSGKVDRRALTDS